MVTRRWWARMENTLGLHILDTFAPASACAVLALSTRARHAPSAFNSTSCDFEYLGRATPGDCSSQGLILSLTLCVPHDSFSKPCRVEVAIWICSCRLTHVVLNRPILSPILLRRIQVGKQSLYRQKVLPNTSVIRYDIFEATLRFEQS